jgi:hypothetical protein
VLHDEVGHLLAGQVAVQREDLPVIDERDVEALPLSADIDADPGSHVPSMP